MGDAAVSDWQPIETAPRDGTPILLFWDEGHLDSRFVGYFDTEANEAPHRDNRSMYPFGPFVWRISMADCGAVAEELVTHWMPLPEPPK